MELNKEIKENILSLAETGLQDYLDEDITVKVSWKSSQGEIIIFSISTKEIRDKLEGNQCL